MNRGVLLLTAGILFAGCGFHAAVENRNVSPVPSRSQDISTASPPAAPTDAVPKGARINRPQLVKFAGTQFPAGWTWIDPGAEHDPTPHKSRNGALVITIPATRDLYGGNRTAPRLLKAIDGDFQIETRVRFDPTEDYQGAGLLIYTDGDNYLRLDRAFGGVGGGGSCIRLDVRLHDKYEALTTPGEIPTTASVVELRITRRANVFSAYWRDDEDAGWQKIEDYASDFPDTIQAGIAGYNTASEITAEFSYIRLQPQPLEAPTR